jgi:hypothetical protein
MAREPLRQRLERVTKKPSFRPNESPPETTLVLQSKMRDENVKRTKQWRVDGHAQNDTLVIVSWVIPDERNRREEAESNKESASKGTKLICGAEAGLTFSWEA